MSEYLDEITAALRERKDFWQGWRSRVGQIRALVENRWGSVFPNDEADVREPMVANLFRHTIEDVGRQFAEARPTERVFAADRRDSRAEKREQALAAYSQGVEAAAEYHGQDLVATGLTAVKVWPDFGVPSEQRFPRFRRLNPDTVLPEIRWAPDKPTDKVICSYTETVAELSRQFPTQIGEFLEQIAADRRRLVLNAPYPVTEQERIRDEVEAIPAEFEVVDWYSAEFIARVALYDDPISGQGHCVPLAVRDNETGICPVQIAFRPTFSREPIGDLDDSKGTTLTRNRYMRLLLDYFIEMVYGGKLAWNVRNPHERGPGTVYQALGPDARMDPVTPQGPSFQALQVLQMLDEESRGPSNPRSREGEVDLNKATAAFLSRAQGSLTSTVRSLQRNWAVMKQRANEAAFAQDEAWCNTSKTVLGLRRGRRFKLTYVPKDLIRGDYANVVSYGAASGLDPTTHQVLTNQKLTLGVISRETAMEQDPTLDDVGLELTRQAEQRIRDSLIDGLALPTTDFATRARAWRAFNNAEDVDAAIDQLATVAAAQPAPQPALPGGGAPALPGGPPGVGGAEQGGSTIPLPPLASLRRMAR